MDKEERKLKFITLQEVVDAHLKQTPKPIILSDEALEVLGQPIDFVPALVYDCDKKDFGTMDEPLIVCMDGIKGYFNLSK